MKTKEELNVLRNEVKDLKAKLAELSDDELKMVYGGIRLGIADFADNRNRDLGVDPQKSDTGTVADENNPPPDINHRELL